MGAALAAALADESDDEHDVEHIAYGAFHVFPASVGMVMTVVLECFSYDFIYFVALHDALFLGLFHGLLDFVE